jgi:hypothetical protein
VRGVQGAHGGRVDAGLGRRDAAPGPSGFGRDPQVARVAALELGDERPPGGEPAGEDVHGRPGERVRLAVEVDAGFLAPGHLAVQVQRAELEVGDLGDAMAGVGDDGGHRRGAQRGHGVGVDRPLDGEVVQQLLGVARGQVVAAGRRLALDPGGLAAELGEGVEGIGADPHGVRVGRRVRAPEGVAGAGLALGRVGEPGRGPLYVKQVPRRQLLLRPGGLLRVAEVLVEEGLADPAGARGQVAPGEMPEKFVDCVARRGAGVQGWHAQHNSGSFR